MVTYEEIKDKLVTDTGLTVGQLYQIFRDQMHHEDNELQMSQWRPQGTYGLGMPEEDVG